MYVSMRPSLAGVLAAFLFVVVGLMYSGHSAGADESEDSRKNAQSAEPGNKGDSAAAAGAQTFHGTKGTSVAADGSGRAGQAGSGSTLAVTKPGEKSKQGAGPAPAPKAVQTMGPSSVTSQSNLASQSDADFIDKNFSDLNLQSATKEHILGFLQDAEKCTKPKNCDLATLRGKFADVVKEISHDSKTPSGEGSKLTSMSEEEARKSLLNQLQKDLPKGTQTDTLIGEIIRATKPGTLSTESATRLANAINAFAKSSIDASVAQGGSSTDKQRGNEFKERYTIILVLLVVIVCLVLSAFAAVGWWLWRSNREWPTYRDHNVGGAPGDKKVVAPSVERTESILRENQDLREKLRSLENAKEKLTSDRQPTHREWPDAEPRSSVEAANASSPQGREPVAGIEGRPPFQLDSPSLQTRFSTRTLGGSHNLDHVIDTIARILYKPTDVSLLPDGDATRDELFGALPDEVSRERLSLTTWDETFRAEEHTLDWYFLRADFPNTENRCSYIFAAPGRPYARKFDELFDGFKGARRDSRVKATTRPARLIFSEAGDFRIVEKGALQVE